MGWYMRVGLLTMEVLDKVSLGEFLKNGQLTFNQHMVNPYTYTQFIVTEEPFEDADPNAAGATGGTQLQTPFGR